MIFQIASDIHIERLKDVSALDYIVPNSNAEVLILAGDIGSLYKLEQLREFIQELSPHFKYILYVLGNHEYYRIKDVPEKSIEELRTDIYNLGRSIKNLTILNKKVVRFDDICVIGATLWSNSTLDTIPHYIVRNTYINQNYNDIHRKELEYIIENAKRCRKNGRKVIIVSHHCPTLIPSRSFRPEKFISLYSSNLDHFLKKEYCDIWIYGHTHENVDVITKGETRLVCNQKGKVKDKVKDFSKNKTITI